VNALIRYPTQPVLFIPGFWQQIKWGWIQYLSILIPFLFVFKLIKIFIFENQLVPTIVISSQKLKDE
jgi:transmembrane protein 231